MKIKLPSSELVRQSIMTIFIACLACGYIWVMSLDISHYQDDDHKNTQMFISEDIYLIENEEGNFGKIHLTTDGDMVVTDMEDNFLVRVNKDGTVECE